MKERIETLLSSLLEKMGVEFEKIEITETSPTEYNVNILSSQDSAVLIGWHGQTLLALQSITRTLLNKGSEESLSLTLDIENYRKKQVDNIIELAERKAQKIVQNEGGEELMPPMHPYFRKVVHAHFTEKQDEFPGIRTESVGTGEERQLKIFLEK